MNMTPNSTHPSGLHSLRGATLAPAPAPLEPVSQPPQRPSLLSRVGKYVLIVGGMCAAVGAVEGALTGALLAPSNDPGTLIMIVALDRCILLGLAGAGIGAVIGAFDWC